MADAHGSGPCESNLMEVQVLLSAPNAAKPTLWRGFCFVLHDFYTILYLSTLRKMQKAEPHKRLRLFFLFFTRFGAVSYILPEEGPCFSHTDRRDLRGQCISNPSPSGRGAGYFRFRPVRRRELFHGQSPSEPMPAPIRAYSRPCNHRS